MAEGNSISSPRQPSPIAWDLRKLPSQPMPEAPFLFEAVEDADENERWQAMLILADWLEENNEPDLAFAFRWASRWKRWPLRSPHGRSFRWGTDWHAGKSLAKSLVRKRRVAEHHHFPYYFRYAPTVPFAWSYGTLSFRTAWRCFEVLAVILRAARAELATE